MVSVYNNASIEQQENYIELLTVAGSLSELFSENSKDIFIHYRMAENLFCKAFKAQNLARDDSSYDALRNSIGVGIKTFIIPDKGESKLEKIAEFNKLRNVYANLDTEEKIKKIAEFRNDRIDSADNAYGNIEKIYHCIARVNSTIKIFEMPYQKIDLKNIKIIKDNGKAIHFEDGLSEYSFSNSKSVLMKKFNITQPVSSFEIKRLKDPIEELKKFWTDKDRFHKYKERNQEIYLPLFSPAKANTFNTVPERSQLNQWNARGRSRDFGEIYVPVPAKIHNYFPDFFPDRGVEFMLHLPNSEKLNAKLTQDGRKGLMTNPNNALATWLLRKILLLKEGELLTYERLQLLDVGTLRLEKLDSKNFKVGYGKIEDYENQF